MGSNRGKLGIGIYIIAIMMMLSSITPYTISQPAPPHNIWGIIKDQYGNGINGANVTLTNQRTGDKLYTVSYYDPGTGNGSYMFDLSNLPSGWEDGDNITIQAYKEGVGYGEAWIIADAGTGSQRLDITLMPTVNNPPVFSNENPSNNSVDVSITLSTLSITIEDPEGDLINWTIETSPNIGSASGTLEANGTKTCSISGLQYGTTYKWWVNATDLGSGLTTSKLYIFTTESAPLVNNPPYKPTNVAPADGATFVSINPTLTVHVIDPDGDSMDVYFYGREQGVGSFNLIGTVHVANDSDASIV